METKYPLSAYELTACYNQEAETPISAVSVYRILDFLASVNLAYRLTTLGKYIACERFGDSTHADVTNLPEASSFEMSGVQIEVMSLCKGCRRKTTSKKQEKA